jgi:hypothetical protein
MAARVQNIWTATWPNDAMVGLTRRCRQQLSAEGIIVYDAWSDEDKAAVGQEVVNGNVKIGPLETWESRLIYCKI